MGMFEAQARTTLTTKCADWPQQARAQGTASPRTFLRHSSETTQQHRRNGKEDMCVAGRPRTQAWRAAGEERPASQCPLHTRPPPHETAQPQGKWVEEACVKTHMGWGGRSCMTAIIWGSCM